MMTNFYETYARTRKAVTLMLAARQYGVTAEQVSTEDITRSNLVAKTGVNTPSDETWAVVVALLKIAEESDADPFAELS